MKIWNDLIFTTKSANYMWNLKLTKFWGTLMRLYSQRRAKYEPQEWFKEIFEKVNRRKSRRSYCISLLHLPWPGYDVKIFELLGRRWGAPGNQLFQCQNWWLNENFLESLVRLKALYLGGDSPRFVRILAHRGEEWRSVVKGYLKVIAMVMVMVIVRDIVHKNIEGVLLQSGPAFTTR